MKVVGDYVLVYADAALMSQMAGSGFNIDGNALNINGVSVVAVGEDCKGIRPYDKVVIASIGVAKNNMITLGGQNFLLVPYKMVKMVLQSNGDRVCKSNGFVTYVVFGTKKLHIELCEGSDVCESERKNKLEDYYTYLKETGCNCIEYNEEHGEIEIKLHECDLDLLPLSHILGKKAVDFIENEIKFSFAIHEMKKELVN